MFLVRFIHDFLSTTVRRQTSSQEIEDAIATSWKILMELNRNLYAMRYISN